MKTAMQELLEEFDNMPEYLFYTYLKVKRDELLEKEKEQMIDFYNWMRRNDSAEGYFHYSDKDMLEEYYNQNK